MIPNKSSLFSNFILGVFFSTYPSKIKQLSSTSDNQSKIGIVKSSATQQAAPIDSDMENQNKA